MIALKSKWFKPYTLQNGRLKPSLNITNKKFTSGVYFIKSISTNKIIYIGYSSSNLYKTIYRHFQKWNDIRERRVYQKHGYLIRIIFTTPKRAEKLEQYLIQKINPKDNNYTYENSLNAEQLAEATKHYNEAFFISPNEEAPF